MEVTDATNYYLFYNLFSIFKKFPAVLRVAVDLVAMEFPTLYRHHSIINVKISTPIKPQFKVCKFYSYMRLRGRLIVKMVHVIMTTPSVDPRFLRDSFCIQMPAAFFSD